MSFNEEEFFMTRARISALKFVACVSTGIALAAVLGCGDDTGLEKRYPVHGTVKYNGKPVERGRIDFIPAKSGEGRAAGGDITNGAYSLTTATKDDGALPGTYKVSVSAVEIDMSSTKGTAGGGQAGRQTQSFAKVQKDAKMLVPQKFGSVETSGLTQEVKQQSNTIDIDLKD
jgi:hypothetical protein